MPINLDLKLKPYFFKSVKSPSRICKSIKVFGTLAQYFKPIRPDKTISGHGGAMILCPRMINHLKKYKKYSLIFGGYIVTPSESPVDETLINLINYILNCCRHMLQGMV